MKDRIVELRNTLGLTQAEFGAKIGLARDGVASYERGVAKPTGTAIIAMAKVYGVRREWLESGELPMFEDAKNPDQTLNKIQNRYNASTTFRAMLDVYATMTSAQQDAFEEYINLLTRAVATGQNPATVKPSVPTEAEIARSTATEDAPDGKLAGG